MEKNREIMKEMEHRLGIIIEAFDQKLDFVVEGVGALRENFEHFRDDMQVFREEVDQRFVLLRIALKALEKRFDRLDQRMSYAERDIKQLQSAV